MYATKDSSEFVTSLEERAARIDSLLEVCYSIQASLVVRIPGLVIIFLQQRQPTRIRSHM